jgi:nucleoid-associated protein YgaU
MRLQRIVFVVPALLTLAGCGYIHVGRMPAPGTTVIADQHLLGENAGLRLEKKMLQQELALSRAQREALRMAIENRASDGDTSRRLVERLNESSRELAALRGDYARLQSERDRAVATAAEANALKARLGAAEEQLAVSLRAHTELQQEVIRLRGDVARSRDENLALSEQVKAVTATHEAAQVALTQLNRDLLNQKEARVQAEQDAEMLHAELKTLAPDSSLLARQRSGVAGEARSLVAEHAAETAELKAQLDGLHATLATLEGERLRLQQLVGVAPAPDLANVEGKLASVLQENEQLKTIRVRLEGERSELENQIARLEASPAAGQAQVLRDQLREARNRAIALTEENARLQARISGAAAAPVVIEPVVLDPTRTAARTVVEEAPRIDLGSDSGLRIQERPRPPTITRGKSSVSATLVTSVSGTAAASGLSGVEAGGQRVHVVTGGDTLAKISALYYGTPARWGDILAANRDVLGEANNLVVGRALRIP